MMTLYLAVPCYNEEAVLQDTTIKLLKNISNLLRRKKYPIKAESFILMTAQRIKHGRLSLPCTMQIHIYWA